jgi:translation elongation factor EF-Tu-like GTPase
MSFKPLIVAVLMAITGTTLATDRNTLSQAIAAGAKLTKADAARVGTPSIPTPGNIDKGREVDDNFSLADPPAAGTTPATSARGIEKKDIRRGMVIAKPGGITTPYAREERKSVPSLDPTRENNEKRKTFNDTTRPSVSNIR